LIGYRKAAVARTPLAEVAGRTKPIDTKLMELARVLAK
jgi:6-phosphofructokinase 1